MAILLALASMATIESTWGAAGPADPLADPDKLYHERLLADDVQRVLKLVPKVSSKVYEPPEDWQTLRFDSIELKLPLGANWVVFITNNSPNWMVLSAFNEDTNRFVLSNLGPDAEPGIPYPPVSYQDMRRVLCTIPDDLTEAGSLERKREIVTHLLAKAINKSEYIREWIFVETPTLKAMIHRSPSKKHGRGSVHVNVWNRPGTVYFYVMAAMETSPFMGQQILGGVRFHGDAISAKQVNSDIAKLLAKQPGQGSSTTAP